MFARVFLEVCPSAMLQWTSVKSKTKRKHQLREAAAVMTLAVAHKNRCVRRALSQVRHRLIVDGGPGAEGRVLRSNAPSL